jgi:hypothetical protein
MEASEQVGRAEMDRERRVDDQFGVPDRVRDFGVALRTHLENGDRRLVRIRMSSSS